MKHILIICISLTILFVVAQQMNSPRTTDVQELRDVEMIIDMYKQGKEPQQLVSSRIEVVGL